MPYITVDVDVDLDEFSDDDLLEELDRRQLASDGSINTINTEIKELIEKIHLKRMFQLDFLKEVDELIYEVTGRIV